jgi:hypothetical protein
VRGRSRTYFVGMSNCGIISLFHLIRGANRVSSGISLIAQHKPPISPQVSICLPAHAVAHPADMAQLQLIGYPCIRGGRACTKPRRDHAFAASVRVQA